MSKSRARLLAELLNSTGLVKKSKSALSGADEVIDLDSLPTIPNSKLTNSSISIAGHSTALGGSVSLDTEDISEHTSYLYFTNARADARVNLQTGLNLDLSSKDTGDLSEGSNLYYTDARADARVALIVDSAPGTLNTLNELAAALGDDANFSTTVTNSIATKMPLAGGTFTGNVNITKETPYLNLTDSSASRTLGVFVDDNNSVLRSSGPLLLQIGSQSAITIDASRNTTFAGTIASGAISSTGNIAGSNLNIVSSNWLGWGDYGERISGSNTSSSLYFSTDATTALTLDGSQNATFAGTISSGAITSSGNITAQTGTFTGQTGTALTVNSGGTNVAAKFESTDDNVWINLKDNNSGTYGALLGHGDDFLFKVADNGVNVRMGLSYAGLLDTDAGYSVAGTTVIDSSRNLTNIGTISSGAITSSAGITAKRVTITDDGSSSPLLKVSADDASPWAIQLYREDLSAGPLVYASSGNTFSWQGHMDIRSGFDLKMNTVSVIDSSRNLTNIGTISSGAITSTGQINIDPADATLPNTYFSAERYNDSNGKLIFGVGELSPSGNATGETFIGNHNRRVHIGSVFDGTQTPTAAIQHFMIDEDGDLFVSQNNTHTKWLDAGTRNLENIGTISSGAITSTGNMSLSNASAGNNITINRTDVSNSAIFHIGSSRGYIGTTSNTLFEIRQNDVAAIVVDTSGNTTVENNLVVDGNLTVSGTTTTLNTATLDVEDKNITLNYSTGDSSASADGAGITIQDAVNGSTDATILWNASSDLFNFSHKINVQGDVQAYNFYGQDVHVLNSAGTGWHEWATRANDKVTLDVSNISSGAITSTGNFTLTKTGSDAVIEALADSSNDSILNLRSTQGSLPTEGFQIWYDNSVGDVHLHTTYPNDQAAIRFHTRTGANKATNNERFTIQGNGDFDFHDGDFSNVGTISSGAITTTADITIPVTKKLYFGGGNHTYISEDVDDRLRFFTGGAEFMRFTESTTNSTNFYQPTTFTFTDNIANQGFNGIFIDHNISGSQAISGADYTHISLNIDTDSSVTTGDTADEHRVRGANINVRVTGDSDQVFGTYSSAEGQIAAGTTTEVTGVYGIGIADELTAGRVSQVNALRGITYGYGQGSGGTTNFYGVNSKVLLTAAQTKNSGALYGGYFEVETDNPSQAVSVDNIYGVFSHWDDDSGGNITATNSFLFYGTYTGTGSTTGSRYGVYINTNVTNFFAGLVRSNTGFQISGTTVIDSSRNLTNIGTISSGAITSSGSVTGTYFTDGYVTWNAAQFNRSGAYIELQWSPVNSSAGVRIGGNTSNPIVFDAYNGTISSGVITAPRIVAKASGMSEFATSLGGGDDWQNSPITIRERGAGSSNSNTGNNYAPNLNFHWAPLVSRSIWMKSDGSFNFGEYNSSGTPSTTVDLSPLNADSYKVLNTTVIDSSRNAAFAQLTVTDFVKASGSNLKFSAGGNHIMNIDLNGKIYPQTDNYTDLGFSATAARFRNLNLSGNITVGGSTVIDSSRNLTNIGTISSGAITSNADLTLTGNGTEIRFTGGNNRILFSGYRALEGATDGGNLQLGEGYSLVTSYGHLNLSSGHEYQVNGTTVISSTRKGFFSGGIDTNTSQLRVKISPWTGTTYGYGMKSGMTYGGLANEYALTSQMNSTAGRGFWWGTSSHTDAQGAMALTNDGKLTVNHSLRLGYGVNDTTTPGAHALDVSGSISASGDLYADGGNLIIGDDAFSADANYVGLKTSAMTGTSDYMIISAPNDGATYISAKNGLAVNIRGGGNNGSNEIQVPDSSFIIATTSNFYCTGNVTAYYSSDQSLKQNIRVIDNPIEKIKQIRGVYFDWTDDYIKEQSGDGQIHVRKDDVGVIAQDVQPVLDEVVTTRDDGTLAVRYEKMVALCIEAIKEQSTQITAQQEQINELTKRVNALMEK